MTHIYQLRYKYACPLDERVAQLNMDVLSSRRRRRLPLYTQVRNIKLWDIVEFPSIFCDACAVLHI